MAYLKIPKGWEIPEREAAPEHVYLNRRLNRRKFLAALGLSSIAAGGILPRSVLGADSPYPAKRNPEYPLDRPMTPESISTRYNNFIEFSHEKDQVWQLVDYFKTEPWTIQVSGLVHKKQTLDLFKLIRQMPLEERLYRHRCVEAWSMAVPWTGFPLKALLDRVQPASDAKFIRMVSFYRPDQAPGQQLQKKYPWPYYDGLTMEEAMNDLTFLVTGMYGHELPKQNGAPIRLAVPWKYVFKSIKSIAAIEFLETMPKKHLTFWHDVLPDHYDFSANVDPDVPHPRWSQKMETELGTWRKRPTLKYNGYGKYVAHLYE